MQKTLVGLEEAKAMVQQREFLHQTVSDLRARIANLQSETQQKEVVLTELNARSAEGRKKVSLSAP